MCNSLTSIRHATNGIYSDEDLNNDDLVIFGGRKDWTYEGTGKNRDQKL